jgi:hypothetical protein
VKIVLRESVDPDAERPGAPARRAQAYAAPGLIGLGVLAGTWFYGIVDAPKAANRQNQRLTSEHSRRLELHVALGAAGSLKLGLGLRR